MIARLFLWLASFVGQAQVFDALDIFDDESKVDDERDV